MFLSNLLISRWRKESERVIERLEAVDMEEVSHADLVSSILLCDISLLSSWKFNTLVIL